MYIRVTGDRSLVTGHSMLTVFLLMQNAGLLFRLPTDHPVFGTRKWRLCLKYDTLQFSFDIF